MINAKEFVTCRLLVEFGGERAVFVTAFHEKQWSIEFSHFIEKYPNVDQMGFQNAIVFEPRGVVLVPTPSFAFERGFRVNRELMKIDVPA